MLTVLAFSLDIPGTVTDTLTGLQSLCVFKAHLNQHVYHHGIWKRQCKSPFMVALLYIMWYSHMSCKWNSEFFFLIYWNEDKEGNLSNPLKCQLLQRFQILLTHSQHCPQWPNATRDIKGVQQFPLEKQCGKQFRNFTTLKSRLSHEKRNYLCYCWQLVWEIFLM